MLDRKGEKKNMANKGIQFVLFYILRGVRGASGVLVIFYFWV